MLLKKMVRDLWKHKGTYLSSMILIIIGILIYNMFSILYDSFSYSLDKYYEDYKFAHGTVKIVNMPKDSIDDILRISEIKNASGRLEKRVRLLDDDREVIFQFMSYDSQNSNRLNDIELIEGRMPEPDTLEIIMGNYYFNAMNLEIGDLIPVIVNGKEYKLTIVGYGRSPEFIYAKKNDNELISDPKTFDLVYMPYESMSKLFRLKNQVNNVAFTLYDENKYEQVKIDLKKIMNKYGIQEITSRDEQISHVTTRQKLDGIGSMTQSIPMIFLLVSGVIIYIVLKRVIEQERTQIGVLKAFGITDLRILVHYISYAVIIAMIGGSIGAYIGIVSVPGLIELLGTGFNMPFVTAGLYQNYVIKSFLLTLIFSVISGYAGAKNCIKLLPADAMRPPVSKVSKEGLVDKLYWLIEDFDIKINLALRNIFRNKGRSIFILLGIAITAALLTFPVAMDNMYSSMLSDQFEKIEIYDMKLSLNSYVNRDQIVKEIVNKDGIKIVEPMMQLPVEIYNDWRSEEISIISLPLNSNLYHLFDSNEQLVELNSDGLMLSHWVAKKLKIEEGDTIKIKSSLFRNDQIQELKVTKIIPQYIGSNGYMNIDIVEKLLEGRDIANILMINGSEKALRKLAVDYKRSDVISTFDFREDISGQFDTYLEQTTAVIGILVFFGLMTGFAVIYVSLTISMSERNRELATMLVMGMSEKEVHQVLIIEQFIIAIFGILAGLPLGKLLLVAFAESSSTEYLVMPANVPASAMVFSVFMTIVAIIIPQIIGRKKIDKIIVTEALNARE